jgi:hypothetical protein
MKNIPSYSSEIKIFNDIDIVADRIRECTEPGVPHHGGTASHIGVDR